jgi:hypothetical protein
VRAAAAAASWVEVSTGGSQYWWNRVTDETRWERPHIDEGGRGCTSSAAQGFVTSRQPVRAAQSSNTLSCQERLAAALSMTVAESQDSQGEERLAAAFSMAGFPAVVESRLLVDF